MWRNAPGLVPNVLAHGIAESGSPYFISEYKDLSRLSGQAAIVLGKRLATELHTSQGSKGFGFEVPTFCGATKQKNGWFDTWEGCFDQMIGDLLTNLETRGSFSNVCSKGARIRTEYMGFSAVRLRYAD